ncbi:protein LDOC1-like [Salvelinus sp. IW2-2015]|uniref:protein LDOC1-like n=1 Tax=Salvelinus sp. IW2-2015 TaxID=2691554 RepID=UPI0038D456E2
MTCPADLVQLRYAISSQGATIGRDGELVRGLMEGFRAVVERHDQALDPLQEKFSGLSTRQSTTSVTFQPLNYPAGSSAVTPVSLRFDGELGTCRAFLAQCSLVMELQPSFFPSNRSKIAYLITLMSRRALAWVMAVWEQQSAICFSMEGFMAELK